MKSLEDKLNIMKLRLKSRKVRIMIIGLGSVGNYLLDYLMSMGNENIEIYIVGRDRIKMESDVNIVKVSALIRGKHCSKVSIISNVDLNDVSGIAKAIDQSRPDIIVNCSRAYPGLKYGSISWSTVRAYGIWTPLSMRFVKNIMEAYERIGCDAVVINTSYSDAVIPWMKSAGKAYPDFGSGNINHLIYRFKLAAGQISKIEDYWNIDITFAVSHFHDVLISKEGCTDGMELLLDMRYQGKRLNIKDEKLAAQCKIPMPSDAKRNMMNASSNFEIIQAILDAVWKNRRTKLHCPGVFGEIGGYPIIIDGTEESIKAHVCEDCFDLHEMRKKNRDSIYQDGIADIKEGKLVYSDELLKNTKKAFGVDLIKEVSFDRIEETADFIIKEIIQKK